MNETHGEIEINFKDLFSVLLKRWWLILIATFVGGALLFGYAYATYVPTYQSTAKMYVNNKANDSETKAETNAETEATGEGFTTVVEGKLTMATNAYFQPYEYYEGDKIVGIDAEIAEAIAVSVFEISKTAVMIFKNKN